MTEESILKRKADLVKGVEMTNSQIDQLQAQLDDKIITRNATQGAILECNFWLKHLTEPKPDPEKIKDIKEAKGGKGNNSRS